MHTLVAILLLAVFIRHGAIYWLADLGPFTPAAMSYMLGGLEEIVLAFVIAVLLAAYPASPWRNLGIGAAAIATLEGAQMAGCRALITDIAAVPARTSLCDHLTLGLPVGAVTFTLYQLVVSYAIGSTLKRS